MSLCLVTGATGAIGTAIARRLALPGNTIVLHYHMHREEIDALAAQITALGAGAIPVEGDLRDLRAVDGLVQRVMDEVGTPHAVVHAAGTSQFALLQDLPLSEWRNLQDVHLGSAYRLLHAFLPGMIERHYGRFVLIGSVYGERGGAMEAGYAAAKAGYSALARATLGEVGRSGVTVNVVAPGAIDTPMLARLSDQERQELRAQIPLGRLGRPEEVAAAVAFLLSPPAGYISGCTLRVDGGYSI